MSFHSIPAYHCLFTLGLDITGHEDITPQATPRSRAALKTDILSLDLDTMHITLAFSWYGPAGRRSKCTNDLLERERQLQFHRVEKSARCENRPFLNVT